MSDDLINMLVTYTEGDLVKLEFFQDGERILWVDLTREQTRDWAAKLSKAAETFYTGERATDRNE